MRNRRIFNHLTTDRETVTINLKGDHMTTRTWGNLILESEVLYGNAGSARRFGRSGGKIHILHVERVVGVVEGMPVERGTYAASFLARQRNPVPLPVYFSSSGACGGNGQNTAYPIPGLTLADVTCTKCLKRSTQHSAQ